MSELKELCKEIIKSELKVSEKMEAINANYTQDEIDREMINVVEMVKDRADDPTREMKVHQLTLQLAQAMNSQTLAEYSRQELEDFQKRMTEDAE